MRKLMAIGLAGALATASVGATATSAKADPVTGAVVVAAVVLGVLFVTHHHAGPFKVFGYYVPGADDGHTAWCTAKYKTYNAETDTFTGNDLRQHRCISP
jgi:hypothetical protein